MMRGCDITMNDYFCGAGGSSTGALQTGLVRVRTAANHWDKALETHASNHAATRHVLCDLSSFNPRRIPAATIGWFSPECTHHSSARGKKRQEQFGPDLFGETLPSEAAERSRATMWDVPRFTEAHRYQAVIVENVFEVLQWVMFDAWLLAMTSMGYRYRIVSLNAMHAWAQGPAVGQSRDRVFIVFWKAGNRAPDLDGMLAPPAWCERCGQMVAGEQAWKPGRSAGRYRAQYLYQCRVCHDVVEPVVLPASSFLDLTNTGTLIGDRTRPLKPRTMERIRAGIEKYWGPLAVPLEGRDGLNARSITEPLRTMTTRNETGLATPPFIAELRGTSTTRPASDPLSTITAGGFHHALVTAYYGKGDTRPVSDPIGTVTTHERHALLVPAGGTWNDTAQSVDEPIRTVTTRDTTALVMRNHTPRGQLAQMVTPAAEPIRTITASIPHSVLAAEQPTIDLDQVYFRMVEPAESKLAQGFPGSYVMVGTRREQQILAGNAVPPPCGRDLVAAVAASLQAA